MEVKLKELYNHVKDNPNYLGNTELLFYILHYASEHYDYAKSLEHLARIAISQTPKATWGEFDNIWEQISTCNWLIKSTKWVQE